MFVFRNSGTRLHSTFYRRRTVQWIDFFFRPFAAGYHNMTENLVITSPVFRSLLTPELLKLTEIFKECNFEIRIAGGAVRDILMNIRPVDIDLATTATPAEMKKIFGDRNIRTINFNGEKHGTVTPRIDDKENFEVTTLRIDKNHDGRWAEVEFTQDWVVDAGRRDLTINSMFLGLDGRLYDYFNGSEDLLNRRIRFVGDPSQRIQEDYLRILRYFRFYGRISDYPDSHEPATVDAIKTNLDGLKKISGERLWTEFRQIAVGRFADAVLNRMMEIGIGTYLGLPEMEDRRELFIVWKRAAEFMPKPMTIISTLIRSEDMDYLHSRLKLSNEEFGLGSFLTQHRQNPDIINSGKQLDGNILRPYQHLMAEEVLGKCSVREAKERVIELIKYQGDSLILQRFMDWEFPKFPISGYDMLDKGIEKGVATGIVMEKLRRKWVLSDFEKTREELLSQDLPGIVEEVASEKFERKKNKRQKKTPSLQK